MKTVLFSALRRNDAFTTTMFADLAYAGFSILFVVGFLCFHTKSLFLGSIGMLLILFSFPITGIIFGAIAQISYYHVLQMMVIFIILGIAADDIFVVVDAWNQSALFEELRGATVKETKVKRMSYTLRRSGFAILVTSSTTAVAFLANVNSKLMPIKAFGAFAAIIVLVNYFLFVFYFPAILMLWDQRIRNKALGCAFKNGCKCGKKVICKRVPED
jgi:predicted RND superfamily exporter protein